MRVLVTGKNGQLGNSIHKIVTNNRQANEFIFVGREALDLGCSNNITDYFYHNNFDIIVNCAAYTAVDKAEEEQKLANQINHLAVKQLAEISRKQNARLIHVSTDYVFDGYSNKPYKETDETNPINEYGKTKLAGEHAIQEIMLTNAVIVRTGGVYSEFGNNFVKTMLRIGREEEEVNVVSDQICSTTYATDLAEVILKLIDSQNNEKPTEIYHYANQGKISWYDFSKQIFKSANIDCLINSIKAIEYPTLARRPQNSYMNKEKIQKEIGINSCCWKKSLAICIATLNK